VAARFNDGEAWRWDVDAGERARELIARSGRLVDGMLDLGIEENGRLVGEIQARCPKNGLPPGAFELGVGLFDEGDRGHGIGRRAVALMTSMLFDEEGAHRVQLSTDVDNAAMRAVVEHLRFGFEGVLRGFMPDRDGPRDYAMYGLTRQDYEDVKTGWI